MDIYETAKLTEKERERYEESIKVYRDNLSIIDAAVQEGEAKGYAEGLAKGFAEGLAKSRAQRLIEGESEGFAKGFAEGEAKVQAEIALNLKAMGMELSNISKATGLSEEEISKL